MTYDTVATLSQVTSLLLFIGIFLAVVAYAFWPKNGPRFELDRKPSQDMASQDRGRK